MRIKYYLLAALSLLSLFLFINFKQYAFPEYAIDLTITPNQAQQKASTLLDKLGIKADDFKKSTVFEIDQDQKTYLERELGSKTVGELAKKDVDVWYFTTRFFQVLQKEEIYVSYAPDGRLVGFEHIIPELTPAESLNSVQAENKARDILAEFCSICQKSPDSWKIIQNKIEQKQNRTDHTFVFESTSRKFKDAPQKVKIILHGDQLGQFDEYIDIPQAWIAGFDKAKSYNLVAQTVAEVFYILIVTVPLIILFLRNYKKQQLRLKIPYIAGIIMAAITVLGVINTGNQWYFEYPNDQAPVTIAVLLILGLLVAWFFTLFTSEGTIAAAESVYRQYMPEKNDVFSEIKNIFRNSNVNKALGIGIAVGLSAFSYELGYYIIGRKLGYWVPADINYNDAYNSIAPWIYPLTIGLLPAISEEVMFRLFAIPLYFKFFSRFTSRKLKSIPISLIFAVSLSSITWAFLHSAYPQMPFFARGLELTVIGLVFAMLFLRYGILASIAAHYTFNAMQMAIFFLDSKNDYASISGFVSALLPFWLFMAGFIYQKFYLKKSFAIQKNYQILSQFDPDNELEIDIHRQVNLLSAPQPLTSKTKVLVFFSLLFSFLLLIIPSNFKDYQSSEDLPISSKNQIIRNSDKFLKDNSIDIQGYQKVLTVHSDQLDPVVEKYLTENTPQDQAVAFVRKNNPPTRQWRVRYFKPLQIHEIRVYLDLQGNVFTFRQILPDDAVSTQNSSEIADSTARDYLTSKFSDPFSFKLISKEQTDKKNRIEFSYSFEGSEKLNQAVRLISFKVIDGIPQNLTSSINIPEDYQRQNTKISSVELITLVISVIAGLLIVVAVMSALFWSYKYNRFNNKIANRVATIFLIFHWLGILNQLPTYYQDYNTSLPLWVHHAFQLGSLIVMSTLYYFTYKIILNGAFSLYRNYIGQVLPFEISQQKKLFADAIYLSFFIFFTAIFIIIGSVATASNFNVNFPASLQQSSEAATSMERALPFLNILQDIPLSVLIVSVVVILITSLRHSLKSWKKVIILLVLIWIVALGLIFIQLQSLISTLFVILPVTIYLVAVIFLIAKNNPFYYILQIYYLFTAAGMAVYLDQQDSFWRFNGLVYLLFMLMPFIIWWKYHQIIRLKDWLMRF